MPTGRCPNCGASIEAERRDGATFECAACGAVHQLVLKDGKFTAKRLKVSPPQPKQTEDRGYWAAMENTQSQQIEEAPPRTASRPQPKQIENLGYWAAMEKTRGQQIEEAIPAAPPRTASRPQPKPAALEVQPRIGWFLLLFLLIPLNLFHIPLYQVLWNKEDVTLPIIGTLTGKTDLERDELAATTTGFVTETQLLMRLKKGSKYQVRYTFEVNGQWYTYADSLDRTNLWADIDEDVWNTVDQALENGGQPTIGVRYLKKDPWINRPVDSGKTGNSLWILPWIGVFFISLITFEQIGHVYANYKTAQKAAKVGKKGKIMYWEVRPKKE